jgi:mediator of RNA polymerase II transcription subunit 18
MHELLLYGQVPFARHDQVLKILAGVAAMQPHRVLERHIIYKPVRQPMEPGYHLGRGGGSQNVEKGKPAQAKSSGAKDLYYQQLVQKLDDDVFGGGDGPQQPNGKTLSAEVKDGEEHKWSLEFYDLPDTGDKGVSIRMTHSTHLLSGDPHAWMVAIGPHQ